MRTIPDNNDSDLLTITILVNGNEISSAYKLYSIVVEKKINCISSATITLLDGDPASECFPASDSPDFIPGTAITIKAGYDSNESIIFSGIVIKHSIQCDAGKSPLLIMECKDDAIRMTSVSNNAVYKESTDSDVITNIIAKYGLQKTVAVTNFQNKELVQYYCTDWHFILSTAAVNGMIVTTEQGCVAVTKPDLSQSPVMELTYGESIISFDLALDAGTQYSSVQAGSWDLKKQSVLQATAQEPGEINQGNISSSTLAGVMRVPSFNLQNTVSLEKEEIQNLANARLLQSRLSKIKGTIKTIGSAYALPGKMIGLRGVGARFNGNAFISAVSHTIEKGNWITTVTIGLNDSWSAGIARNTESPSAAGLLPGISGLQNGIVHQIENDPDNQYRVLVTVPMMNNKMLWARLTHLSATSGSGSYFYPETGDEVVLGFFNDDPRFPVILGSLYSSAKPPAYVPDEKNNIKAIVSRSRLKIEMDDDKKLFTLITPANNSVVLNDDTKSITLSDENGNIIEMSSSGINFQSTRDITIKATGNISLEATGKLHLNAMQDVALSGMNITNEAQLGFTAKGNATAEISASGQTVINGGIVMIN